MTRLFGLFCCVFLWVDCLRGQDTAELPRLVETTIESAVAVPDAGHHFFHKSSPSKSAREILAAAGVENQRCSKTEVDGITTYEIIHDNKPLKLVVFPDERIEMTIVREFNTDNAEQLRTEFPELIMDFNAFPKTAETDSRVRLNLEVETTYSFAGPDELEQQRPELHRIYHQYTRPPIVTWSK